MRIEMTWEDPKAKALRALEMAAAGEVPNVHEWEVIRELADLCPPDTVFFRYDDGVLVEYTVDLMKCAIEFDIETRPTE